MNFRIFFYAFVLVLFLTKENVQAQTEKILETTLGLPNLAPSDFEFSDGKNPDFRFYIKGYEIINGNLNIYSRFYKHAIVAKTDKKINLTSGFKWYPVLGVSSFNLSDNTAKTETFNLNLLDFSEKEYTNYTIEGTTEETGYGTLGNNETDMRLQEVTKNYPASIAEFKGSKSSEDYLGLEFNHLGDLTEKYFQNIYNEENNFSVYQYEFKRVEQEAFNFSGDYKLWYNHEKGAYNPHKNTITRLESARRKGKEFKWNEYKEFAFVTYSNTGKIVGNTTIKFNFVKDEAYLGYVNDFANKSGNVVCLFGQTAYQKKYNDPDPSKYTVAVLDEKGTMKYKHEFKFGENKRELLPKLSFQNNGTSYLIDFDHGKGINIINVNEETVNVTNQNLSDIHFSGNSDFAKSFFRNFDNTTLLEQTLLDNGNLLYVYEYKNKVQDAVKNPQSGLITQQAIYSYAGLYALEINTSEAKVDCIYGLTRQVNQKTPTVYYTLIKDTDKIILVFNEEIRKKSTPVDYKKFNFFDNQQNAEDGGYYITKPNVVSISFTENQISSYKPSDEKFVNLYSHNSYIYIPENDKMYLIGLQDEENLEKITFELIELTY